MSADTVTLTGSGQLVVAWSTGADYGGAHLAVGGDLAARLLEFAQVASADLSSGHPYGPDVDMEDSTHLVAERADLQDTLLLQTVEQGADLPLATEKDIADRSLTCYALVVGSGTSKVTFIRKRSPVALGSKALVGRFLSGEVTEVSEPLFAFDKTFDLIVTSDKVLILNKSGFDSLFRHSAVVLAKTPDWVTELAAHLPLAPGSDVLLNEALQRNQFHRNKFQAILKRPHIRSLTPADVEDGMRRHGLDPAVLMPGGQLVFDTPENTKQILNLLNEDLFKGEFSGDEFAAGSKRRIK
ncbi:Kiwa anti-phage protein KwaB-like domain-containing protein [Nocardioides ultimimeridianus]